MTTVKIFILSLIFSVTAYGESVFTLISHPDAQCSVNVNNAALAQRFKLKFIKPSWKASYDNLTKITSAVISPNNSKYTVHIGNFGKYELALNKISSTRITADYKIELVENMPLELVYVSVLIPCELAQQKGKFSNFSFPLDIQNKPLFLKSRESIEWNDGLGRNIKLSLSEPARLDLVDNRRWNKPYFELQIFIPNIKIHQKKNFHIDLETSESSMCAKPFIDKFGQCTVMDWPEKVVSENDLRQDALNEMFFRIRKNYDRDKFGGWIGTQNKFNLQATGFFYVQKVNDRWWFVDPAGNLFFSLASFFAYCDTYTNPKGKEASFEWLPPKAGEYKKLWEKYSSNECVSFYKANLMRKYGQEWGKKWYLNSLRRWINWGFNSTSAFGNRFHSLPYANGPYRFIDRCAPMIPGAAPDVFDPEFPKKLDDLCKSKLPQMSKDRYFIGYFFGNEQPFEKIRTVVPQLPEKYAAKRKLAEFLKNRYKTIDKFNQAWRLSAKNFEALLNLKFSPSTRESENDMDDFLALYCDTYGRILRNAVKKYDPNHLLLGFRWMPSTARNKIIVQNLGRYLDVVSINYYTDQIDPNFVTEVSRLAGDKPVLLSEWSYGTTQRGHINAVQIASTQKERGLYYQSYVETAAAINSVVGCHWFEYADQAITGRYSASPIVERCNYGLVDITDRPYSQFIQYVAKTNSRIYDLASGKIKPVKLTIITKKSKPNV